MGHRHTRFHAHCLLTSVQYTVESNLIRQHLPSSKLADAQLATRPLSQNASLLDAVDERQADEVNASD